LDADHFDAFARIFSSRRRLVVSLSGLALGALAPLLGVDHAEAGKNGRGGKGGRGKKKNRKKGKKRSDPDYDFNPNPCDPNRPLAMPCGSTCCDPGVGQSCCAGQVCCPSGKKCCGSRCCDFCSPEGLCGICPPCIPPDTCINGYCKSCPEGEGYTICITTNGAPVCCHTNPSSGTPMKCEGGACVAGDA
jgi:hypothetical protein